MTFLRAALAGLVVAAGLVLTAHSPAFACSCATADTPDFVKWADVVVVGEVTEITPPPESELVGSADPVAYTVEVDEVLKGDVGATVEVISARFGASCGLEGIEEGGDYVVFATYQDGESRQPELWADLCGGTRRASGSHVAEIEALTGPGHPPEPDESSPPASEPAAATAAEPASDDSGVPGWVWAGGAAVGLVIGGLLVARRRRTAT